MVTLQRAIRRQRPKLEGHQTVQTPLPSTFVDVPMSGAGLTSFTSFPSAGVVKLATTAGFKPASYLLRDVQADEIWSFIGKKEKRKTFKDDDTLGDSHCWVAIEAKTKLVLPFVVGKRTTKDAIEFTRKLRRATSATKRWQLTTDGLQAYIPAVDLHLSDRSDYAQLIKIYSSPRESES